MSFEFKNPEVAAKYEPLRSKDGIIDVPCGKHVPNAPKTGYHGKLSGITLAAADKAYAHGAGLLKLKEQAKTAKQSVPAEGKPAENKA